MADDPAPASRKLARALFKLALGARLPRYQGTAGVRGLHAEVTVRRDAFAVPYIEAKNAEDAWFALGFCHAQERAAQLEIIVRAVRGKLAAMVGPEGLPVDRLSRRIGFRRAAEAQLALFEPAVVEQIAAFVRGLNAGLELGPVPHELALLRVKPSRWEPADVQGYSALFCFALASNWDVELTRLKVLVEDGPEALAAIDAPYPAELPLTIAPARAAGTAVDHLAGDLACFAELLGTGGGSNAWAVAPSRTKSGRPILANDPHLVSALPTLLYLAQLRAPGLEVAGATWVGIPAFAPGHNGFAAWGVTAAHADNTDLFLEEIGPDGVSVREGGGYHRCQLREEIIEVRGRAAVIDRVLVGPRGPIVASAAPGGDGAIEAAPLHGRANALSLSASWLARRPYTGLYLAHRARSFAEFRELFRKGSTSTVSTVYADAAGHIGWLLAAEIPTRAAGHGLLPMPGWLPGSTWGELVPFDALPRSFDPSEGYVCTANNQPAPNGVEGPYLGVDWLDGYRAQRLAEALGGRDDWDMETTIELQRDTVALPWRSMRDAVLAVDARGDADCALALAELARWDGRLDSSSTGASVYALFTAELCDRVVRSKAPRAAAWALGRVFTALLPHSTIGTRRLGHLVRLVREQPSGWFGDWQAVLRETLARVVKNLRRDHGPDPQGWRWGRVRPLTLVHAVGQKAPLDHVFNIGPLEGEGDNSTIAQGGMDFTMPTKNQAWLPMLRSVIDVGAWDECRFALTGGQSGNPLSPHYHDQIAPWRSGAGVVLRWSADRIRAEATRVLTLEPR
jgi:penicillin G amidase